MRPLLHDIQSAIRSFRRRPRFAAAVVATLALGIAPNCVIFAIMDAVYFRPLPYPDQQRLALVNISRPSTAALDPVDPFTFREWQGRARAFESIAAYRNAAFNINDGERPERLQGQLVTVGFFRTLGMTPALGRAFRPEDAVPGTPHVLIISHRTWKEYFSGRPDIVGRVVRLDAAAATVVGVMPARFTSFMEGRAAQAWVALAQEAAGSPGGPTPGGNVIGRLVPGVTVERARSELESMRSALAQQFPDFYRDRGTSVRDFRGALFGGLGPGIRMLSVIVGLLLLIACANAANLLLARSAERAKEVAVRTALGVRRLQLARGLVTEGFLLAAAACAAGLLLAGAGIRLLWAQTAPIFLVIGVERLAFGGRVVVFALLLTVLTTVLFAVMPAFTGSRVDIVSALKDGGPGAGRGRRRGRTSRALVVGQVALCLIAMVASGLVLRSLLHFARVSAHPGFRANTLLVATLPDAGDLGSRPAGRLALLEEVETRIAGLPDVERVAMTSRIPFLESGKATALMKGVAGDRDETGGRLEADVRVVDPDFFAVMSLPLLRGRAFGVQDDRNAPAVVVISDRLAAAHWNGADPIGDRVLIDGTWRTVIGVVASTVAPSPFHPSPREAFLPYLQSEPREMKLVVQARRAPETLAAAVRRQVAAVDPDQPIAGLETMEQAIDGVMTPFRLILELVTLFGTIALALAAVGLYGVIARGVASRTREMGIRMAVGASGGDVARLVVREGLRLSVIGLAVGLLPGMAMARILPAEILGVRGLSTPLYAAIVALWLGVALLACVLPARRASRVDTMVALRAE